VGFFFQHGDLLTPAYLDHKHIPRRWRDQLGLGQHIRSGDVSLDVQQPAKGPDCAKGSVWRGRIPLFEQSAPPVVEHQRLIGSMQRQELLNNRTTQNNRVAQPSSERPTIARAAERKESLPSTRALLRGEAGRRNKQTVLRTMGRDLKDLEPAFITKYGWRMALEWQMWGIE
jgi:hypothetical protein